MSNKAKQQRWQEVRYRLCRFVPIVYALSGNPLCACYTVYYLPWTPVSGCVGAVLQAQPIADGLKLTLGYTGYYVSRGAACAVRIICSC